MRHESASGQAAYIQAHLCGHMQFILFSACFSSFVFGDVMVHVSCQKPRPRDEFDGMFGCMRQWLVIDVAFLHSMDRPQFPRS